MATTTPRIGLTKPDLTDLVDVGVLNTNFDKIDSNIASTKIQATKPTTANSGDLWWDSDTGTLYVYYVGASSSSWVAATSDPINIGVVANQTERDAQYPTPAQGMSVWRQDLGAQETYYGLYNASTNPGGRSAAGWATNGAILQIVSATTSTPQMNNTTSFTSTTLTATITPKKKSSKIIVLHALNGVGKEQYNADSGAIIEFRRNIGGSEVLMGYSTEVAYTGSGMWNLGYSVHHQFVDSHNSETAVTYNSYFRDRISGNGVWVQRQNNTSEIILIEVGA